MVCSGGVAEICEAGAHAMASLNRGQRVEATRKIIDLDLRNECFRVFRRRDGIERTTPSEQLLST